MTKLNTRINEIAIYTHETDNPGKVMLAGRGYSESYTSLRDAGFTPAEIASYKAACAASVTDERMARNIPILNKALRRTK